MKLTGSYLGANLVLYCLAGSCFGFYFYFSGNNPIKEIRDIIRSIYQDKIKHHCEKIKIKKESQK
jgi:S-ribosylhomocysteine lyase LuxS involved in autoinducer biosynthesis